MHPSLSALSIIHLLLALALLSVALAAPVSGLHGRDEVLEGYGCSPWVDPPEKYGLQGPMCICISKVGEVNILKRTIHRAPGNVVAPEKPCEPVGEYLGYIDDKGELLY